MLARVVVGVVDTVFGRDVVEFRGVDNVFEGVVATAGVDGAVIVFWNEGARGVDTALEGIVATAGVDGAVIGF
jgi:hypothetical protein